MSWAEVFVVFVISHLVGDYLLQTDWQAIHKRGGLTRKPLARRALLTHVASYTLAFVPALVWLSGDLGANVLWVALLIAGPHLLQDDGRVVEWWMKRVKGADIGAQPTVALAVDQTLHLVALLALALAVGAAG
jgi:hypothetical protein